MRDDVLRRNVQGFDAQRHAIQRFDRPKNQVESRAFCLGQQSPQAEHDAAFPLLDDVQRIPEPDQKQA